MEVEIIEALNGIATAIRVCGLCISLGAFAIILSLVALSKGG